MNRFHTLGLILWLLTHEQHQYNSLTPPNAKQLTDWQLLEVTSVKVLVESWAEDKDKDGDSHSGGLLCH